MKNIFASGIKRICYKGWLNWVSDEVYLKLLYYATFKRSLDLENPTSYNEKLQWIKLHDRKPIYTTMVDKIEVRNYIKDKIGVKYLIPLLGTWNSVDEIDFDQLPNQFVLKCNHNSGLGMCICKDKGKLNIEQVKKDLEKGLKQNYYLTSREWPYKNVKPRIIAEQYIVDESGTELKDYKVMCFEGEPKLIELHKGRFTKNQTQDFYDVNWNKTTISQGSTDGYGDSGIIAKKPKNFDKMLALSKELAKGLHHIRVDWYSTGDKLYFGELTFFDGSGLIPFDDYNDDLILGSWIDLPTVNK